MSTQHDLARSEDGYATAGAAFIIAALTAVIVAVLYLGSATIARHRAQSAADLVALAAAADHAVGVRDPCTTARRLAADQRPPAHLSSCRVEGSDVVLGVETDVDLGRFGLGSASASARAGPE